MDMVKHTFYPWITSQNISKFMLVLVRLFIIKLSFVIAFLIHFKTLQDRFYAVHIQSIKYICWTLHKY